MIPKKKPRDFFYKPLAVLLLILARARFGVLNRREDVNGYAGELRTTSINFDERWLLNIWTLLTYLNCYTKVVSEFLIAICD